MARMGLKTDSVALSMQTIDRLLERGSGDAALLYLYLLRQGGDYDAAAAQAALKWNAARALSALVHLQQLGLAETDTPVTAPARPAADNAPIYTTDDITGELKTSPIFRGFAEEMEHLLGRKCTVTDLRTLLELYDHLAMPAEVLLLITAHLIEETEKKQGPGRRPRVSEVKATAYRWKKRGVDTLDAAEAWLKKLEYFKSREGELLRAAGVSGREAIEAERSYLHRWMEWGFGAETVRLAYERTVLRQGHMVWGYCNGILRSWHGRGLHTPEEIQAAERKRPAQTGGEAPSRNRTTAADQDALRKNAQWMRRMLEQEE